MNKTLQPIRSVLLLAGTLSVLPYGFAAPSAADSASSTQTDQVLTLPEFSVGSSKMEGAYTAGDTVGASRMNAAVKDLPYSIESMTQQLLKDFQIFDLNEDLSYMSAITGNSDAFTFSIRGYNSANVALFNGHYMFNPVVAPFVERTELIKGPAGSLYGQSAPGGILLITTRQPTSTQQDSVSASAGSSYDLTQFTLHSSGPIPIGTSSPKLFYNADAEYLHRTYDVHYARRQEKAVESGLTYKPNEDTNISIEGVWQKFWNPNAADWGIPLVAHFANNPNTGKTGQIFYDGFAENLRNDYYGSPVDYVTREASTYYTSIQHRFSDWLSLQAGFSHYVTPVETYNTLGSSGVYFPAANLVANTSAVSGTNNVNPNATTNPAWSTTMGTGYSYNVDLLSHFKLGKHIDNQILLTIDDYLNNRRNYTGTPIPGTFTPFVWAFNPYQPVTSPYIPRDTNHWTIATTLNNAVNSLGGGVNDRMGFWDNKVILTFGYRHDHYTGYQSNPNSSLSAVAYTGAAPGSGHESHIFTNNDGGNAGLTIQLTPSISWYSSVYQAFTPFNTSVPLTATLSGNAFAQQQQLKLLDPPVQKGVGEETGFKADFFNHELFFTADAFNTQQRNVSVTELSDPTNPSSTTVSVPEGDQDAKGFELTGGYDRGNLSAVLSYSYNDPKVENQGINILANGRRPRGAPMHSLSANVSYSVERLAGLRLLASVHYQGSSPEQSPSTGGIINPLTGIADQNNGEMFLMTPAYAVWNFGAVYAWKSGSFFSQSVNVMVKNAFNREYLPSTNTTLFIGDRRGVYVTYTLKH